MPPFFFSAKSQMRVLKWNFFEELMNSNISIEILYDNHLVCNFSLIDQVKVSSSESSKMGFFTSYPKKWFE
jgi:hypothetical protein